MNSTFISMFFVLVMALVPVVRAQLDCPTIVRDALATTETACQSTGRNQVCYGNISLEIIPQSNASKLKFEQTGDLVDVAQIASLRLSSLNSDSGVWGIALMSLQANLPNTLPGQNVRFLLFGDVEIENAVTPAGPVISMTANGNVNVRQGPRKTASVITTLQRGDTVTAVGRSADSSWVQIQLQGNDPETGWVSAPLLRSTDEVETLDVAPEDGGLAYGPMQAFYFKTGSSDASCEQAPDSGILIQTPKGAGQVNLVANEVNIQLGSTVYLQAQSGGEMTLSVVEGQALVEAAGVTVTVPAGTRVRIPMDNRPAAAAPPTEPEPYQNADLVSLPIGNLEYDITIAPALTEAEIEAATALQSPLSGIWVLGGIETTCDLSIDLSPKEVTITVAPDGTSLVYNGITFERMTTGEYEAYPANQYGTHSLMSFSTPTSGTFETTMQNPPCVTHGGATFVR